MRHPAHRPRGLAIAILLAVFWLTPRSGWTQGGPDATYKEVKVTVDDLSLGRFGWSVAIDGDTVVVGANSGEIEPGPPGTEVHLGQAYVSNRRHPEVPPLPLFNAPKPFFGRAVAISGDTIVVGGDRAAYVFVRQVQPSGETWELQQVLTVGNPTNFGGAVAISGNTVMVGESAFDQARGTVWVFVRDGVSWSSGQRLPVVDRTPDDQFGDSFGAAVAISGNTAIVGAPAAQDIEGATPYFRGAVYIYVRNGTAWVEQGFLTAANSVDLGVSVAISGDTAIIGSGVGIYDGAGAYVTTRTGATWSAPVPLPVPAGVAAGEYYAHSVALSDNRALVSAGGDDKFLGAAYLFERIAGVWTNTKRFIASDRPPPPAVEAESFFGGQVAVSHGSMVISAPDLKVGTKRLQGAVYLFNRLDTDEDGLPDDWEKKGVTIDGVFIDLPKMGANPLHKDIFIHADWMHADPAAPSAVFKPSARAIKLVTDAFAVAPVDNPDHKPGINLHVDLGPNSIMNKKGTKWGALSRAGEIPYQATVGSLDATNNFVWTGIDALKLAHFTSTKRDAAFHYALFANDYAGANKSSGISRGIRATDFLVTLGQWTPRGGSIMQQAGTFMHEFGHNLGLRHGGDDDINLKPNYVSVMNYAFQDIGLLRSVTKRRFDYSAFLLDQLNETGLNETVGIAHPLHYLTLWNTLSRPTFPAGSNKCVGNPNRYHRIFLPTDGLDWDCDGVKSAAPIPADINGDGDCIHPGPGGVPDTAIAGVLLDDDLRVDPRLGPTIWTGTNRTCDTPVLAGSNDGPFRAVNYVEPGPLTGFNDWSHLDFTGGGALGDARGASSTLQTTTPLDEPTMEQILNASPQELQEEEALAPLDEVTLSSAEGPPRVVDFDGSASTAVAGTIVDWAWDFGDGTTGSGATVQHTYTTPGEYFASLDVTDSNGHVNLVPLLNLVTVLDPTIPTPTPEPTATPEFPAINLTSYKPGLWSDKLVVSTVQGTHTDANPVTASDPLYVDLAILNDGNTATAAAFVATLSVDGAPVETFTLNPPVESFGGVIYEDVPVGPLSTGQHTLLIAIDTGGAIAESDESDNQYSRVIDVQPGAPTPTRTPTPATTPTRTATPIVATPTPASGATPSRTGTPASIPTSTSSAPVPSATATPALGAGDVDPTFTASATWREGAVYVVLAQPDGKILVGGAFEAFAGCARNGLARINADGTCDPTFDPGSTLPNTLRGQSAVRALALQPDGRILVGLSYALFATDPGQDPHRKALVRLASDGTRDASFDAGDLDAGRPGDGVESIALQSTGRIIVGGYFVFAAGTRVNLARLDADGSVDPSFALPIVPNGSFALTNGVASADIAHALVRSDDTILLFGKFSLPANDGPRRSIALLNADGSVDPSVNANATTSNPAGKPIRVDALAVQSTGKMIVTGDLRNPDGVTHYRIARLDAGGTRDPGFGDAFAAIDNTQSEGVLPHLVVIPATDKVLVEGFFSVTAPVARTHVLRLNVDGTVDASFDTGITGVEQSADALALKANGQIIVGGRFATFAGAPAESIVQLAADGSRDPAFDSNGSGLHAEVRTLLRQPDGKLLVGYRALSASGQTITKLNALRRNGIGRLNADGSTDATFVSPCDAGSGINAIVRQPDGPIVISGSCHLLGSGQFVGMARLDANGTLDPTFATSVGGGAFAVQTDGKILTVVGSSSFATRMGRLKTDGSPDDDYPPIFVDGGFDVIMRLPDDRVLIAGVFTSVGRNGVQTPRNNVARLEADGSVDPTFNPGLGTGGTEFLSEVRTAVVQTDGKIIIGGDFSSFDGTPRDRLTRLNVDGTLDASFEPENPNPRYGNEGVTALALQPDGKLMVGSVTGSVGSALSNRAFRLNTDGSLDDTFPLMAPVVGGNARINAIVIQPDTSIVIGGEFDQVQGLPHLALARLLGGAPTPSMAEDCFDCVDNDGDDAIDRDDADCSARADGAQLGLVRPGAGKAIAKCAKTIGTTGTKLATGMLKHLQKCLSSAFTCVASGPDDAKCAAKARAVCAKELAASGADRSGIRGSIEKQCAAPAIEIGEIFSVAGLGYEAQKAICALHGIATLASAGDVADCLVAQHACRVANLVVGEFPRAAELLRFAGRDPSVDLPCVTAGAESSRGGLDGAKGKLAIKCQSGIAKAGTKLAAARAKVTQKCLAALYACVQLKPSEDECHRKADVACRKALAKLNAAGPGAPAGLAAAIAKSCSATPFGIADVLAENGLGFGTQAPACAALGVPSLGSLADVSSCLARQHVCRVGQMIETEMPRADELLGAQP